MRPTARDIRPGGPTGPRAAAREGRLRRLGGGRVARCVLAALLLATVLPVAAPAGAAAPTVLRVRYWTGPDHTRVVLDLSGPAGYEVRRVGSPERIAVNVAGARFADLGTVAVGDGRILRLRRNALPGRAQLVLDLPSRLPLRHFALAAAAGRPDRIVLDVQSPGPGGAPAPEAAAGPAAPAASPPAAAVAPRDRDRPFVVVLDPGHGGLDPGAVCGGVREKDVALAVARRVAALLGDLPGYRAVLTREGDYFVSLARRVRIAREREGDLFLSIHANTHPRSGTDGMEVYFLSLEGATDREARELADKENAADLVGLAPDERRDDSVISILMDLRMARVLNRSSSLAERILAATAAQGLEVRRVKQARFQVLRSLAMPSALVELAYLSNRDDRKLLASGEGQRRLAAAVLRGILDYRRDGEALAALAGSEAWERSYEVRRGDTLWELARRHGTTVDEIRERNNLPSGRLLVGQSLRLPGRD